MRVTARSVGWLPAYCVTIGAMSYVLMFVMLLITSCPWQWWKYPRGYVSTVEKDEFVNIRATPQQFLYLQNQTLNESMDPDTFQSWTDCDASWLHSHVYRPPENPEWVPHYRRSFDGPWMLDEQGHIWRWRYWFESPARKVYWVFDTLIQRIVVRPLSSNDDKEVNHVSLWNISNEGWMFSPSLGMQVVADLEDQPHRHLTLTHSLTASHRSIQFQRVSTDEVVRQELWELLQSVNQFFLAAPPIILTYLVLLCVCPDKQKSV